MAKPGATIILVARFSFFCMEIGLAKSFGVLVPELEDQLQTSNAIIGLITSLSLAASYLGSPIAKMLLHRCSRPQMLTSFCGLAAGCSLISLSFTRNIAVMGILFISVGLCCSVVNLQALVLLHEYYQEGFAFVSCISVLGVPIGAAILPPITGNLLEHYGLSGTLLIVGALVLNMLPIGLVLKVPRTKRSASVDVNRKNQRKFDPRMVTPSGTTGGDSTEYVQLSTSENVRNEDDPESDFQSDGLSPNIHRKSKIVNKNLDIQNVGPESSTQEDNIDISDAMIEQYPQSAKDTVGNSASKDKPEPLLQNSSSSTEVIHPTNASIVSSCLSYFYFDVLVKEPLFSIFYLPSVLILFLVTGGWALFIVLYAVEHGFGISGGTYLATSGAVGGILSSIIMSIGLRYRPEWSPQYWIANNALFTVMFFLQTVHSSYGYLLVASFLIGFGLFGVNVILEAVMSEVVQKKNFPDAGNLFFIAIGIGYIASGYISGFVQDQTGNIKLLFIFFGVSSMVGLVLMSTLVIILKRRQAMRTHGPTIIEVQHTDETRSL